MPRVGIVTQCHYNIFGICRLINRENLTVGENTSKPLGVRLPDELKQWLKHRAVDNHRSLNAEINVRLEESRRREESGRGDGKKKKP